MQHAKSMLQNKTKNLTNLFAANLITAREVLQIIINDKKNPTGRLAQL